MNNQQKNISMLTNISNMRYEMGSSSLECPRGEMKTPKSLRGQGDQLHFVTKISKRKNPA